MRIRFENIRYSLKKLLKLEEEAKRLSTVISEEEEECSHRVLFGMVSKNNSPSLDLQELLQGNNCVLFDMCLINVGLRTSLFWAITQRVVVIPYRRFRTTYWSHLQCPCTTARYVIIQKIADLNYFAAEG